MQDTRSNVVLGCHEFDHWSDEKIAQDYHTYIPKYENIVIPWVLDFYHRQNPSSIGSKIPLAIDVACGPGKLTGKLAPSCDRVIGVDISQEMLAVAKKNNAPANTEYRLGSAFDLSRVCSGEKADIITVGEAISYFDTDTFFDELKKCLRPGGVFAAVGYTYVGVDIQGLEHILEDFEIKQFSGTHIWRTLQEMMTHYKHLRLPFEFKEYYEANDVHPLTRGRLKGLFLSEYQVMNDGIEGVERFIERVPAEGSFNLMYEVFGVAALQN